MTSRRSFLKAAGIAALSTPITKARLFADATSRQLPAIGVQLYMVKEDMAKDAAGTLSQLGKMGYTQIESFGGDKGVFWGMTNKDFNAVAQSSGLAMVSSHYAGDKAGYENRRNGSRDRDEISDLSLERTAKNDRSF